MPEQVQSRASLLTLTASKPPRAETARDAAGDFGAELTTAVEEITAQPAEPSTGSAARTKAKDAKAAAERSDEVSDAETAEAAASEAAAAAAEASAVEEAETNSEEAAEEAELLATFVVTETIVLETSPDVVLPEDATTMIDVESGANYGVGEAFSSATEGSTSPDASAVIDAVLDSDLAAEAEQSPSPFSNEGDPNPTQLAATTHSDAEDALLNSGQPQAAIQGSLDQGSSVAVADAAALRASDSAEIDKSSTEQQDAESHDTPEAPRASATEAALAVAALPRESDSDSGESSPHEAADPTEANAIEGARSRDAARAESADEAALPERPNIDPARFVSRVSRAIEFADQRGGGPVELRLSPPELGSLQVKIQVKDGVMTAKLEVETPAARNALLDNLPALRDRLEQQQVRIDKFDVDVRDQQQQRGGDWRQHQDQRQQMDQQQPRHDTRAPRQPPAAATTTVEARPVRTISYANNGINLVV